MSSVLPLSLCLHSECVRSAGEVGCYAEKKEAPLDNDKTLLNSGSENCITQHTASHRKRRLFFFCGTGQKKSAKVCISSVGQQLNSEESLS
jgi:hypothetical protein